MPNRIAAQALWVELSTRITTQRLHFRSGEEETAAQSVFDIFARTRELMEKHPDAKAFEKLALALLNDTLRPYTARWHGWMTEDEKARDANGKTVLKFRDEWVRRQFRRELSELQPRLIGFRSAFEALKDGKRPKTKQLVEPRPSMAKACLGKRLKSGVGQQVRFTGKTAEEQAKLIEDINKEEHKEIRRKRSLDDKAPITNAAGLALSGGGIRSATFCLGVAQILARRGLFRGLDYLSTVSGGGYFGAFLSSYLGTDAPGATVAADEAMARIDETFQPNDNQREPEPLRHLRNRSRYLVDGGFLNTATGIGLVLAGVLFNLLIVIPFPVLAAVLTVFLNNNAHLWGIFDWTEKCSQWLPAVDAPLSASLVYSLVLLGTVLLAYPWVKSHALRVRRERRDSRLLKIWNSMFLISAAVSAGVLVLWLVPLGFRLYHLLRSGEIVPVFADVREQMESLFGLVGVLTTLILGAVASKSAESTRIGSLLNKLAILSGPILYLFVYFGVGYRLMFVSPDQTWSMGWVAGGAVAMLAWGWICVNVNTHSPHGYYRDRLSRCYLIWRKRCQTNAGSQHPSADKLRLTELNSTTSAPYHLINTTVNLPSSDLRELRGRNGDFFLFSKSYCGSPVCGYYPTKELEEADPHIDLGTAMAISGAAASSNMGWKTSNSWRLLMTVANVRLGYWLRNPLKGKPSLGVGPGPLYLLREMFANRMDERQSYLNLSDGGHIENLATYELLRRRCKFIVCVDGGLEPGMECADLMRLERYAAIDLGIRMHYDLSDLKLQSNGYSRAYGVLVKIDYDPPPNEGQRAKRSPNKAAWGWMLYIKLAMIGHGPGYVIDYKRQHPDFPHESTGDQIYDEAQFEAYRALGEAAAEGFFSPELIEGKNVSKLDNWFQALASSLLPDNDEAFRVKPD